MSKDSAGNADLDAVTLYRAMNVPVKDSMLGPGKLIEDAGKKLQFICAIRNNSGYECAIFIQKSANGSLSPTQGWIQYKVTGHAADEFTKLFHTDAKGEFHFVSVENNLKVHVKPQYFEVLFNKNTSLIAGMPSPRLSATLIIAEVEDTLKIAHMQSFWDALNYVQDTESRFLGMNEVLQLLAKSPISANFVYSIQPLELLAGRVQAEFLTKNKFPRGQIVPHRSSDDVDIRAQYLRESILQHNPTQVILIGHNGGIDTEVFAQLKRDFPKIHFYVYIHLVYSTNAEVEVGRSLEDGQTGFVTAVELLLDLNRQSLVGDAALKDLSAQLLPRILAETSVSTEKEKAIPVFVNCQNFYWGWDLTGKFSFASPLKDYLTARCH
ncbi:MAG: hypothetical protein H7326_09460 [Bdellovibrionaceae bacterium]|nr:hypothetical protein [Pseudobdellovibrionaceae bacterium]